MKNQSERVETSMGHVQGLKWSVEGRKGVDFWWMLDGGVG
jgi:hypothetical protein